MLHFETKINNIVAGIACALENAIWIKNSDLFGDSESEKSKNEENC